MFFFSQHEKGRASQRKKSWYFSKFQQILQSHRDMKKIREPKKHRVAIQENMTSFKKSTQVASIEPAPFSLGF